MVSITTLEFREIYPHLLAQPMAETQDFSCDFLLLQSWKAWPLKAATWHPNKGTPSTWTLNIEGEDSLKKVRFKRMIQSEMNRWIKNRKSSSDKKYLAEQNLEEVREVFNDGKFWGVAVFNNKTPN